MAAKKKQQKPAEKMKKYPKLTKKDLDDMRNAMQYILIYERDLQNLKPGDEFTGLWRTHFKRAGYKLMELAIKYS